MKSIGRTSEEKYRERKVMRERTSSGEKERIREIIKRNTNKEKKRVKWKKNQKKRIFGGERVSGEQ